jgi:putative peptidoglycan lipid II flippase
VLLNLSFIGMALFAAPYFDPPVLALAWAVVLGGMLQLALQVPALARIGMMPRPRLDISSPRCAPRAEADGAGPAGGVRERRSAWC